MDYYTKLYHVIGYRDGFFGLPPNVINARRLIALPFTDMTLNRVIIEHGGGGGGGGGGHSHRLYSHNCDCSRSVVNGQSRSKGCSQRSKCQKSQSLF